MVAELLRERERNLISLPSLELFLAEKMRNEVQYELQKRISIIVKRTNLDVEVTKDELEEKLDFEVKQLK